jgi:hypothetical protein
MCEVCRLLTVKALSCSCERPYLSHTNSKRLEFDNEFMPERRRFVVHSERCLGGNAAPHEAIALKTH